MSQDEFSSSTEGSKSYVWKYFYKGPDYKENPQAQCNQCLKWYKTSGGTSNLFSHLEKKHQIFLKAKKSVETDSQRKMNFYYNQEPKSKAKVQTTMAEARKALGIWISMSAFPFSVVENPYFRNLSRLN